MIPLLEKVENGWACSLCRYSPSNYVECVSHAQREHGCPPEMLAFDSAEGHAYDLRSISLDDLIRQVGEVI